MISTTLRSSIRLPSALVVRQRRPASYKEWVDDKTSATDMEHHPVQHRKQTTGTSTVIFRLTGPFTARDMFGTLTPLDLQNMLDFKSTPPEKPPP